MFLGKLSIRSWNEQVHSCVVGTMLLFAMHLDVGWLSSRVTSLLFKGNNVDIGKL